MCIAGEWNFKGPGFTAIAHPAPVNLAKNHGVFVLEDMISPWKTYKKGKMYLYVCIVLWLSSGWAWSRA